MKWIPVKTLCCFLFGLFAIQTNLFSQSTLYDEAHGTLALFGDTKRVADATADGGWCLQRLSTEINLGNQTIWYGPYVTMPAGTYKVAFRMKISTPVTAGSICRIDVYSAATGTISTMNLTNTSFTRTNEWQVFVLDAIIPANATNIEFRGTDFTGNVANVFLDYITVAQVFDYNVGDLYVKSNGNVGIGTNTPQSKLAVNGEIYCKRIKVTTAGWPDYVFDPNYKLRPLNELDKFIQQHHHLPEVPSAKEVAEKGLELGANQAALLQKIEELTLYVIEQNKQLAAQQKLLNEQLQQQAQQARQIEKLNRQVQQLQPTGK